MLVNSFYGTDFGVLEAKSYGNHMVFYVGPFKIHVVIITSTSERDAYRRVNMLLFSKGILLIHPFGLREAIYQQVPTLYS